MMTEEFPPKHITAIIFLTALLVRVAYACLTWSVLGDQGYISGDSGHYVELAIQMAETIGSGNFYAWDVVAPDPTCMPVYFWFLTLVFKLTGSGSLLTPVILQCFLDSMTCILIAFIAYGFHRRLFFPAGLFAALNPTMVVISGLILTDTFFVFFCTLAFFLYFQWSERSTISNALLLALVLGLAAMTRILIAPWVAVLCGLMLLSGYVRGCKMSSILEQVILFGLLFCLCLSPVMTRNFQKYHSLDLTPQSGSYLLFWIVPLTREAVDGTLQADGAAIMKREFEERYGKKAISSLNNNPFARSREMKKFAMEKLRELGLPALLKTWSIGALMNLGAPASSVSPLVSSLPRTGFYATKGENKLDKIWNFFFNNDNPVYAWILLFGTLGVVLYRLIELVGLYCSVSHEKEHQYQRLLPLFLWVVFILTVNGPIATPKYRLPIEPVLIIFSAIGFSCIYEKTRLMLKSW